MRKDVILFAATLAMMSLTSCNENNKKPHIDSKPESSQTENTTFSFEKEYIADTSDFNYVQVMNCSGDKLLLYGVTDSEVDTDNSFELINTGTNQKESFNPEIQMRSVDRYCIGEKGVYISYADENYDSRLALSDLKTGKIIADVKYEIPFLVIDMHIDEKGRLWVIKTNQCASSTTNYIVEIYSDNLALQSSFDLSEKIEMDMNEFLLAETTSDRMTYMLSSVFGDKMCCRIHKFSADFSVNEYYDISLGENIQLDNGKTGIFSDKKGNLYISDIIDEMSLELYRVDFENRTLVSEETINDVMMVYSGTDGYDLVYRENNAGDGSIYGYNFSDHQSTLLCSIEREEFEKITSEKSYRNYVLINTENENMFSQCMLSTVDIQNRNKNQVNISGGSFPEATNKLYLSESGDIYCFMCMFDINCYDVSEKTESSELSEERTRYLIGHYDSDGKYIGEINITSYIGDGEEIFVDSLYSDADGNIFIVYHTDGSLGLGMTIYLVCDSKGNKLMQNAFTESCKSACIINSGKTVVVSGSDSTAIFEFDIEKAELLDFKEIDTEIRPERIVNIYPEQGRYDFFYADARSLYGYISDSEQSERIFCKEDIGDEYNSSSIRMFFPCGEKDVVCYIFDDSYKEEFYLFKRK